MVVTVVSWVLIMAAVVFILRYIKNHRIEIKENFFREDTAEDMLEYLEDTMLDEYAVQIQIDEHLAESAYSNQDHEFWKEVSLLHQTKKENLWT